MITLERRVLDLLERLFALEPAPVDVVLSQSADHIADALQCEKVDVFLLDEATQTLVAVGTSRTELAQLQKSLGLHRLPLANMDPMAHVFEASEVYRHGHIDQDARQPRGIVEQMGVRSMVAVPFDVGGVRRGVLSSASRRPDAFSDEDLTLSRMVAAWIGSLAHRAELMFVFAAQASDRTRRATAEELVTVLAHDLRNLLNPLGARLALILERAKADRRVPDVSDCERCLTNVEHLGALMTDLLDVARIEQGLLSLSCQAFDLVLLVRECAGAIARPDVEVLVSSYAEPLAVVADRGRLSQAIQNVLSNAVKHSPRGAPVHVELQQTVHGGEPAVRVTVLDRGPGIPADVLPRIFERYVRAGADAGLGLGLYLARTTLAAHGGTIEVTSADARGTRCELVMPCTQHVARD
ncbi:MAG TPA: GAF domain-containing sensor histidine kinase [Polyangiales bacterium]|nr:GAF domain-containing sensor histidine kinase [Polyangiales bacterium]